MSHTRPCAAATSTSSGSPPPPAAPARAAKPPAGQLRRTLEAAQRRLTTLALGTPLLLEQFCPADPGEAASARG
ncbi:MULTISPECIES: hypothetical protein [unclassified Streptomyces]|uniref:hypothetical protein n=1 Tax=unclassified Streptomyces TaxID=2593676 RepID=UPI002E148F5A|nr:MULTISPECIES: hypothetical protein [unclassified Streptomyces]WSR23453.1 hypothetical protein OG573_32980 [Streptomyces sp. NBC_01205]